MTNAGQSGQKVRVLLARTAPWPSVVQAAQILRRRRPNTELFVVTQAGTEAEAERQLQPDAIVTAPAGFMRLRALRYRLFAAMRALRADEGIIVDGRTSGGFFCLWVWVLWLGGARKVGIFSWRTHQVDWVTPWWASLTMSSPGVRWPLAVLSALAVFAKAVAFGMARRLWPRRRRRDATTPATVLFVAHESFLNGSGNSLLQMLRVMDRRRFTPIVAVPDRGPLVEACEALGIEVAYLRSSWMIRQQPRTADLLTDLAVFARHYHDFERFLRERSIDLVHTNTLICPDGMLAAWALRIPRVWHFREYLYPIRVWPSVQRTVLKLLADRVVVISDACRDTVGRPFRRNQVQRVWNGIDSVAFAATATRDDARRQESIDPSAFVVGVFGAIRPEKGQHVIAAAAARLRAHAPNSRILIVGQLGDRPSYREGIDAIIREHALEDTVIFVGHRADVRPLMTACDVVAAPSTWDEPFGRIAIEAMALGRAVVATGTGGLREIVVDGETGLLTPRNDPDALADALIALAGDPSRCDAMGRAGRERVVRTFDIHRTVEAVQAVWSDLCGRDGSGPGAHAASRAAAPSDAADVAGVTR
jgi:glycosyltransferase involved in cell wall biosynthesis